MNATTRTEHLQWCKKRAVELIDNGDIVDGWASFLSDMRKHPETSEHIALMLGMQLMVSGNLNTANAMKKFIEGFA